MDYQKINDRMIYGLVLQVFAQNLVTYIIIAIINTAFGVAQVIIPFFGLFGLVVTTYLGAVSFMVVHKTILEGEVLTPGEAFAITPQSKTYFWQYLMVTGIPVLGAIVAVIFMIRAETFPYNPTTMGAILFLGITGVFYLLMSFFGTSLVATAVRGDGMMMVSRGRETFFYSLLRLLILPSLALAVTFALVYFAFIYGRDFSAESLVALFVEDMSDTLLTILLLSVVGQLIAILFNLITAVIVTKAFLLAEVRLAVKGQPTEWGKRAFGISEQTRGVVYK